MWHSSTVRGFICRQMEWWKRVSILFPYQSGICYHKNIELYFGFYLFKLLPSSLQWKHRHPPLEAWSIFLTVQYNNHHMNSNLHEELYAHDMKASLSARLLFLTVTKVIYSLLMTDDSALTCSLIGSVVSHPSLCSLSNAADWNESARGRDKLVQLLQFQSLLYFYFLACTVNEQDGSLCPVLQPIKQERRNTKQHGIIVIIQVL